MNANLLAPREKPATKPVLEYENKVLTHASGFLKNLKTHWQDTAQTVEIWAEFETERFNDDLFEAFQIYHQDPVAKANQIRKAEYLAGRVLARLAGLHLTGRNIEIPVGATGEPIWPDGLVGSLSHSKDVAICLASAEPGTCIGVDVQHRLSKTERDAVCSTALTQNDIATLQALDRVSDLDVILVFSAKETLFKALYPATRVYIDFSDFAVSGIDPAGRVLMAANSETGARVWGEGPCPIRFELRGDCVLTRLVCNRRG